MIREKIVKEIIETEETYVKSLEDVMTMFITPLQKALEKGKPIIPYDDVSCFVEQFRPVMDFNMPFRQALRERLSQWHFQMCFADLFTSLDNKTMFEIYARYTVMCSTVLDRFTSLCQTNKEFRRFVSVCERFHIVSTLSLDSVLITFSGTDL